MARKKYLYHGSSRGSIRVFEPRIPSDIGTNPDNKHKGVYATDSKKWAMVFGLITGKGVGSSSTYESNKEGIVGVTYKKTPRFNKYFYVYTFDAKDFKNIPKGSEQYMCAKKVKPVKVERFLVKDYLKWIRPANKKEMERFQELLKKSKKKS